MTATTSQPSRFFCQLGNTEFEGTSAFFDSQQVYLRENKICGFIEIQVNQTTQVLLLFAQGVLAGTYLLEGEDSKPFQIINLSTVWDGKSTPIRTVEIPQTVGRMMWLALEAQISGRMEVAHQADFEQQLNAWKSDKFSGVIELSADQAQGIFYIHEGSNLDSEAFFYNGGNFETMPARLPDHGPFKLIAHKSSPASQSQQCLMLRQGVLRWGNGILSRYQELAGQKMLRMAQKDLEDLMQPYGWHLSIQNSTLQDKHFFSYAQTAAQAYRAVFMEIGNQMDQVVGSALTLRILNDAFEALNKDLRLALELHRLIPAAFSV